MSDSERMTDKQLVLDISRLNGLAKQAAKDDRHTDARYLRALSGRLAALRTPAPPPPTGTP